MSETYSNGVFVLSFIFTDVIICNPFLKINYRPNPATAVLAVAARVANERNLHVPRVVLAALSTGPKPLRG